MSKLIDLNGLGHFKDKENAMVAADYSATKTYAVGDYVYYNGTLYRCTTAISTAEAWTSGHWTAAKIANDVCDLKTALMHEISFNVGFVSGGFGSTFNPTTNTKRIRSTAETAPKMYVGDYIETLEPYESRVLVMRTTRFGSSAIDFLTADFVTGKQYIPEEYNGFYFGIIIRKIDHINDDITADIPNIPNYVKFVSVQDPYKYGKMHIFDGLKISVLGDSISSFQGYVPDGYPVFYTGSNRNVFSVNEMWWKVLCDNTGATPLVINAYSGSAVTQLEDESHVNAIPMSSDERCQNLGTQSDTPDIIIIEGGINDYYYAESAQSEPLEWNGITTPVISNSFTEAYACMIKKVQTAYPFAIVVAISLVYAQRGEDNGYTYYHTVGTNSYTQKDYNDAIENVCKQMHIPFIDISNIGFNRSNFYPKFASDSAEQPTHPSERGHFIMGMAIAEKIVPLVKGFKIPQPLSNVNP